MGIRKIRNLPAGLERLRQRFERSRRTRKARSRIPDSLWAAAVTMAKTYGVNRTARTLRLGYYVLKKRVQQDTVAIADSPEKAAATFVELTPSLCVGGDGRVVQGNDRKRPRGLHLRRGTPHATDAP